MSKFSKLPLTELGELVENEYSIKSPPNMIIIANKLAGKTLSMVNKPKILIGDCERGTREFGFPVNNVVNLLTYDGKEEFKSTGKYGYLPMGLFQAIDELSVANDMDTYWKLFAEFDNSRNEESYNKLVSHIKRMPFPIFVVDTIGSLTVLSNSAALYEYNQNVSEKARKTNIKKIDDWGGVSKIRAKFNEVKEFIEQNAAPFIIYNGHLGEKKKILKKSAEDITAVDIELDGLLSSIFTRKASAVGIFYRDKTGCYLDFTTKDESDVGSRPIHLSNKTVKIAEILKEGELYPETHWDQIFPEVYENLIKK